MNDNQMSESKIRVRLDINASWGILRGIGPYLEPFFAATAFAIDFE